MKKTLISSKPRHAAELFTPHGRFARKHPQAYQVLGSLLRTRLDVQEVAMRKAVAQIRLSCGARINVHHSGKVVAEGAVWDGLHDGTMDLLGRALPCDTVWKVAKF